MKKALLLFIIIVSFNINGQIKEQTLTQNILSAGTISVTIGGHFPVTGTYPALITERVDHFITRIFNEAKEKSFSLVKDEKDFIRVNNEFDKYSFRRVILKRVTGEEEELDLHKFRLSASFEHNPYLKNDDVLIFQATDFERNFIVIDGAINLPGKYHFVEGDKLSDAIYFAQGINPAFENVRQAEINRLSYDGKELDVIVVSLNDNIELKQGDRIRILADETQRRDLKVLVVGEVNKPGYISITKDNTTIKDVIKRAGGFKESASLTFSRLLSGKSALLLLEQELPERFGKNYNIFDKDVLEYTLDLEKMKMLRMSNATDEDTSYLFLENELRLLVEGVVIDFNKLNEEGPDANYKVRDGDVIIVPQKKEAVFVFGQVPNNGYVQFNEGRDYLYYINRAGGVGEYATDDIMIIKGKTREWIEAKKAGTNIEAGDYIYVPRTPAKSFNYYLWTVSNYLGIIGNLATIILLLIQFGK